MTVSFFFGFFRVCIQTKNLIREKIEFELSSTNFLQVTIKSSLGRKQKIIIDGQKEDKKQKKD